MFKTPYIKNCRWNKIKLTANPVMLLICPVHFKNSMSNLILRADGYFCGWAKNSISLLKKIGSNNVIWESNIVEKFALKMVWILHIFGIQGNNSFKTSPLHSMSVSDRTHQDPRNWGARKKMDVRDETFDPNRRHNKLGDLIRNHAIIFTPLFSSSPSPRPGGMQKCSEQVMKTSIFEYNSFNDRPS